MAASDRMQLLLGWSFATQLDFVKPGGADNHPQLEFQPIQQESPGIRAAYDQPKTDLISLDL